MFIGITETKQQSGRKRQVHWNVLSHVYVATAVTTPADRFHVVIINLAVSIFGLGVFS
jgi:hypothetical protein